MESLSAVYSIVQLINHSLESYSAILNPVECTEIKEVHDFQKKILEEWNSLQKHVSNAASPIKREYSTQLSDSTSQLCGICIQPLNISGYNAIEFLGITYHSHCANFYLNRIGALLPNLI